jgi:hypothetical protein
MLDFRIELPPVERRAEITPEMLAAGRTAFLRKRKLLDDLWCFYDDDLSRFLSAIYAAMERKCVR